jgi:uncharacterized protein (DUF433 family)
MSREYVENRNDAWYVTGTRVSLDSVIHHFREGASPETILSRFPALGSLANIYGAIAFSWDNSEHYLAGQQQKWAALQETADAPPSSFSRNEHTHPV